MTQDDILRMAREAGVYVTTRKETLDAMLERFAALVAAAEREACAMVCEESTGTVSMFISLRATQYHNHAVKGCAAAIRARGNP